MNSSFKLTKQGVTNGKYYVETKVHLLNLMRYVDDGHRYISHYRKICLLQLISSVYDFKNKKKYSS